MKSITIFILLILFSPALLIAQPMGGWGNGSGWEIIVGLFVIFIYPLAHLIVFIIRVGKKESSNYPFVVARLVINLITILMIMTNDSLNYKNIYSIIGLMVLVLFSIVGVFKILKHKKIIL